MREAAGTVYGDIGTSVLYTIMEITRETIRLKHHGLSEQQLAALIREGGPLVTPDEAISSLSLVFWALIFLTIKYDVLIMRADNRGEGGTFALWGLLKSCTAKVFGITLLGYLVVTAAGLLAADGIITPPISMLGAYEPLGESVGGSGDSAESVSALQTAMARHEQGGWLVRLVHDADLVPLDCRQGIALGTAPSRTVSGVRSAVRDRVSGEFSRAGSVCDPGRCRVGHHGG